VEKSSESEFYGNSLKASNINLGEAHGLTTKTLLK
jgi:hypothetical protein